MCMLARALNTVKLSNRCSILSACSWSPPPRLSSLTRKRISTDGVPADSPVQQQDGVLPGSSGVGAVEVSSLVVAHGLQQGPQLGIVLSYLSAVDCTADHTAVGIGLWGKAEKKNTTKNGWQLKRFGEYNHAEGRRLCHVVVV